VRRFLRRMPHVPNGGRVNHFRMGVLNIPRETAPVIPRHPWDKVLTDAASARLLFCLQHVPRLPS
jgi:hypothetical protein